jgi:Lrp/AsnC family transcriptional regulator for asnA, asnC and gidA
MAYSAIATNKISNTMVHQRINRLIEQGILTGIKPIINEKKLVMIGDLLQELP